MKILVTGYSGQLGYDVVKEGLKCQHEMIGVSSKQLDITKREAVFSYIQQLRPECIVHCAAYTAVDKAEEDRAASYDVNVNGTRYIAEAAKAVDAKFVYISTDYVFGGNGDVPFTETDQVNPIGYYGETKLQGERQVQTLLEKYFILRISWVFGLNGNNFVKTMLRLAETRNELSVVGDQYGSPTYTVDAAKLIIEMIDTNAYGIYHASNEGFCSWSEFAQEVFRQANKEVIVKAITAEEYPTPAVRPENSRMSKQKLLDNGFLLLPKWQDAVGRYINELSEGVK